MFCIDAGETLTAIAKELAKGKQLFPIKKKADGDLNFPTIKLLNNKDVWVIIHIIPVQLQLCRNCTFS